MAPADGRSVAPRGRDLRHLSEIRLSRSASNRDSEVYDKICKEIDKHVVG